ncbi:hypothetical protein [Spirosoma rhododendri]|uniref:Uncharacterized protein n=1 Tax=Spirosoma rhododendri TaxID=2728024 RepID=A0A7L5DYJ1_9BACT|nr:hypothetical protein [Spirosoma rhododendri]QJD81047.1 hypothetical protein HH216_23440 [Spirosoma rhododendri]
MQLYYQEITKEEAVEITGGNWLVQFVARVVDTLCDLSDDLQTNGSNRPYQQYE